MLQEVTADNILKEEFYAARLDVEEVKVVRLTDWDPLHRQIRFDLDSFGYVVADRRSQHVVKWQLHKLTNDCIYGDVLCPISD